MRKTVLGFVLLTVMLGLNPLAGGGGDIKPIAGIGPTGPIKKLQTGFKFTEGPVADGKGNIYFSDLGAGKIHKIDAEGKLSVFVGDLKLPNGLMFNAKGEMVACEMGAGRIIAFDMDTKKMAHCGGYISGQTFWRPQRSRGR